MRYKIIGGGLMLLGVIDLVAYYLLKTDITGIWWFPIPAIFIGSIIWGMSKK